MLLAIDIGNSSTKFGIFDGSNLFHKFSIQTKRDYTVEELLFDRLKLHEQQFIQVGIDTCIVASVVPELKSVIAEVCRELFRVTCKFVDETWDFGFRIDYDPPSAAGADRLVNCFAAVQKYGKPVIVCSFGTATTIDVVSERNGYIGGVIAPGMLVSAKALHLATAKLPNVPIERPASVIGKTTVSSIQSGTVLGHVEMVRGLIRMIVMSEFGASDRKPKVVATGGFSGLVAQELEHIDHTDENLTLDGLRLIFGRDRTEKA